jgi:hypothetical protein
MASPTLTAPPLPTPTRDSRPRRYAWPSDWRLRTLIGLALSVPYIVLAVRAYGNGYSDSSNAALERQSDLIHWGSSNLHFVGSIYPPLPAAIAAILPNAMALGIVGGLAAGGILEAVASRLARHGYPLPGVLVLTLALGGSPSFALTATTDLAAFMALTFLVLSLDGFIRFVFLGQTHGGFQAGLAIGVAGLCTPAAAVCAVGFAVAAPLVARHRYRGARAARATAAVLLFPTVAGVASWIFLCWRFTGSPLGWLRRVAPQVWEGSLSGHQLVTALKGVGTPLMLTPVFVVASVLLLWRRRPIPAIGICLPIVCVVVAVWIGLPFPATSTAVVLGVVGLMALPVRPSKPLLITICVIALAGLAAKWGYPVSSTLHGWEHAVGTG